MAYSPRFVVFSSKNTVPVDRNPDSSTTREFTFTFFVMMKMW